jgi:hypothetical protein
MLSVVVVHKNGDLMPGKGFYDCAEECGRDISDREALWISEIKQVYREAGHKGA